MIKFKITPSRFAEACKIVDYIAASAKHKETAIRIAPRFIVNAEGEYIVKVNLDEDNDPISFENMDEAFRLFLEITPRRLESLIDGFAEAAKAIVNPPNEGG